MQQALKQQCASEVEAVQQEVQHKQRQAARILKAKAEEEAIKVSTHSWLRLSQKLQPLQSCITSLAVTTQCVCGSLLLGFSISRRSRILHALDSQHD